MLKRRYIIRRDTSQAQSPSVYLSNVTTKTFDAKAADGKPRVSAIEIDGLTRYPNARTSARDDQVHWHEHVVDSYT